VPTLKFQSLPATTLADTSFSFLVLLVDSATNALIEYDADNNDVTLDLTVKISTADVIGDSLDGSWILFDLSLSGTTTVTLSHGIGTFTGMSLNVPNTFVDLKVTSSNYPGTSIPLTATTANPIRVNLVSYVEGTDVDSEAVTQLGIMQSKWGQTSVKNVGLNEYVVQADVLTVDDVTVEAVDGSETNSYHNNFNGDFLEREVYKDSACQNKLYSEYTKMHSCVAHSDGRSSSKVTGYTIPQELMGLVQATSEHYTNSTDCGLIYHTNVGGGELYTTTATALTTVANVDVSVDVVGQCIRVFGSSSLYQKISGTKTSVLDSSVCNANKPSVRVSSWYSTGSKLCHANLLQPAIKLYDMETCYTVEGVNNYSFKFNSCVSTYTAVVTEYSNDSCLGASSQRMYGNGKRGGESADMCFVGMNNGWGVGGSDVDIVVECNKEC
jgi:hypothetical protein